MPESVLLSIFLPLAAGFFGSSTFYSILQDSGRHDWLSWGAVLFGAFYLALKQVQRRRRPNAASEAVHLTLAVVFLTIAIPLKASGRWITAGWLAEGVSLGWIASTRASRLPEKMAKTFYWLSISTLGLGYLKALTSPWWSWPSEQAWLNAAFATQIFAMAAVGLVIWLDIRSGDKKTAAVLSIALNLLVLCAARREIFLIFAPPGASADQTITAEFASSAFWMLHGAALLGIGFWKKSSFVRWQGLVLLIATILKVFLYDMRSLSQGYRVLSFIGLGMVLMAVSFAYQKNWLGLKSSSANREEHA